MFQQRIGLRSSLVITGSEVMCGRWLLDLRSKWDAKVISKVSAACNSRIFSRIFDDLGILFVFLKSDLIFIILPCYPFLIMFVAYSTGSGFVYITQMGPRVHVQFWGRKRKQLNFDNWNSLYFREKMCHETRRRFFVVEMSKRGW